MADRASVRVDWTGPLGCDRRHQWRGCGQWRGRGERHGLRLGHARAWPSSVCRSKSPPRPLAASACRHVEISLLVLKSPQQLNVHSQRSLDRRLVALLGIAKPPEEQSVQIAVVRLHNLLHIRRLLGHVGKAQIDKRPLQHRAVGGLRPGTAALLGPAPAGGRVQPPQTLAPLSDQDSANRHCTAADQ